MTRLENPTVAARDIHKSFGGVAALAGVSLSLQAGEVHALLGGNGSGKSTLIKVIAGVESSDAVGGISSENGPVVPVASWSPVDARSAGLRFVHQDLGLFLDLSVMENLFIETSFGSRGRALIPWRRLRVEATDVLESNGIRVRPGTLVSDLSPVQRVKLAVAREIVGMEHASRATLVLDEATAALPAAEADELLDAVRNYAAAGHAVMFVTHRLREVHAVGDRVTVLRNGREVGQGSVRDLSHEDLVEMIAGRAIDAAGSDRTVATGARAARPIRVTFARVSTDELRDADFEVHRGEIVGLAGGFRAGHEHVTRVLFGIVPVQSGTVTVDGAAIGEIDAPQAMARGIAYVPADRATAALLPGMSVMQNMSSASLGRYQHGPFLNRATERTRTAALIKQFAVSPPDRGKSVELLSGGNQQKVVLARWLNRDPVLLLLDEPTQGVDVGGRDEIWRHIRNSVTTGTSVIVVSADYEELAQECDRILVFAGGRVVDEIAGAPDGDAIARVVNRTEKAAES